MRKLVRKKIKRTHRTVKEPVLYVKKRNGRLQKFSRKKIIRGCRKAGASLKTATKVASAVSKKVTNKMPAKTIGKLVIKSLGRLDKKTSVAFAKYFKKR